MSCLDPRLLLGVRYYALSPFVWQVGYGLIFSFLFTAIVHLGVNLWCGVPYGVVLGMEFWDPRIFNFFSLSYNPETGILAPLVSDLLEPPSSPIGGTAIPEPSRDSAGESAPGVKEGTKVNP